MEFRNTPHDVQQTGPSRCMSEEDVIVSNIIEDAFADETGDSVVELMEEILIE